MTMYFKLLGILVLALVLPKYTSAQNTPPGNDGPEGLSQSETRETASAGPLDWPESIAACRPWAYNWWLGSAVDAENLAREITRYRQGGLGGIHIVPIYGAKGAEHRYIDYLSPQWMKMLDSAVTEGQRQGLGVDMTTGTGWCFGGPNISQELGCRNLVVKHLDFPADGRLPDDLRPGRVAIEVVVARGPDGESQEITDRLATDGRVNWTPPGDGWTLYVLGHQFAGRMVKRAAPGGAGPMINPYYAEAMQKYLERFTAAFQDVAIAKPRAMYHDSFEYSGNWSPDLLDEFAKRRGYKLEDEFEALAGHSDPEQNARVRCDLSETRSDMVVETVFPQWVRWCHERGMKTRNQAHGAAANWIDFYALADIPETEMFGHGGPDPLVSQFDEHIAGADRDLLISKFASSAAHVSGKPLVSSETGTWLAEHFCETFEELKCEIDLLFLAGVNHIIYHGCVYSPDDAAWPGWLFYASTQMNPRNPLWREAPALNAYVARCQSILRSGQPDNDVLLYWPIHDAWTRGVGNMSVHNKAALEGALGEAAKRLWTRGYGFDYVSDRMLDPMRVDEGQIVGPDGVTWQAVVIPTCRYMPHTTLAKLADLAEQGATVIFQKCLPEDVPGLGQLDQRRAAFQTALNRLKRASGQTLIGSLDRTLQAATVRREPLVDHPGLNFIRRKADEGWYYFIVNHHVAPVEGWIPLAVPAQSIAVLDPMTGNSGEADTRPGDSGVAEVFLRLEPGHSIILRVFRQDRVFDLDWTWSRPGKTLSTIDGPWQVDFLAGGPKLPGPIEMNELQSWTACGQDGVQAFAGTARYRCAFDLADDAAVLHPPKWPRLLDLGEVKHVARVRVNGQDLGVLVMHPYRLAIPAGLLRAGDNLLEVQVTNLAANRIRDLDRRKVPWRVFHEINLVSINYRPFDASVWPLFDSGLLGPVTLQETK